MMYRIIAGCTLVGPSWLWFQKDCTYIWGTRSYECNSFWEPFCFMRGFILSAKWEENKWVISNSFYHSWWTWDYKNMELWKVRGCFPSILYVWLNGWEANGPLYFSSLVKFRMNGSLSLFMLLFFEQCSLLVWAKVIWCYCQLRHE